MNQIPTKLREEMAADPFYAQCCVTGVPAAEQKVEWHHAMIYAGKQVQERWCIIPLLDTVHANEKKRGVRQVIDWIIFNRATDEELRKYSKTINYIKRREWLNKHFKGPWVEGKYFELTPSGNLSKKRTDQQNKAMHVFFTILAKTLNDAGLDMRKVLKPAVMIPWTTQSVKDQLWRPVQMAMYSKHSTTDLLKQEDIDAIHEVVMRFLGENHHVEHIPFPHNPKGYWDSAPMRKDKPQYNRPISTRGE